MAVIGHDGSSVDAHDMAGVAEAADVLGGPGHAQGHVEVGVDGHAGGPDLSLVAGPAGVGGHPGGTGRSTERGGHRAEEGEDLGRPVVVESGDQSGTSGDDAGGVGQVHGAEVRLQAARAGRGRRPAIVGSPSASGSSSRRAPGEASPSPACGDVASADGQGDDGGAVHLDGDEDPVVDPGDRTPAPTTRRPSVDRARATRGRPVAAARRGARSRPSGEEGRTTSVSSTTTGARAAARAAGRNRGPVRPQRPSVTPDSDRRADSAPSPTTTTRPPASATTSGAPTGSRPSRTTITAERAHSATATR